MDLIITAQNDWRDVEWPQVAMRRNCHLFLNISVTLGTVCMTDSYLNMIPPFLTDCGILQFTPIPQVRTKRYCSFINYSLKCYQ